MNPPLHLEEEEEEIQKKKHSSVIINALMVPPPCQAVSHIMTYLRICLAAAAEGKYNNWHFTMMLSKADVEAITESGFISMVDLISGDNNNNSNIHILEYPGAYTRDECLAMTAKFPELPPLQVAQRYVEQGVTSCEALLTHEPTWNTLLFSKETKKKKWDVFFGDLGWPCASLVADKLDQHYYNDAREVHDDSNRNEQQQQNPLQVLFKKKVPRVLFQGNIAIDPWCELYGAPSPSNEVPQLMGSAHWFLGNGQQQLPMSFIKRLLNLLLREVSRLTVNLVMLRPYSKLRSQFGLLDPAGIDMVTSAQYTSAIILLPAVWGIEPPRALPPNWKFVNPILPQPSQPLQVGSPLAEFLQNNDYCNNNTGFVLISFGTQASLTLQQIDKIQQAISSMPELCFIWRLPKHISKPITFQQPDNLYVANWVPQNDLLGHDRIIAFVSHMGYGSLYEAAYHGVPVVGIPLFGDQADTVHRAVRSGFGIALNKDTFTSQELVQAIQHTSRLKPNAQRWSHQIRHSTPGTHQALEWMDYARLYGVDHLMPVNRHASYVVYYNLDVTLVVTCLLLLVGYCIWTYLVTQQRKGPASSKDKVE